MAHSLAILDGIEHFSNFRAQIENIQSGTEGNKAALNVLNMKI